MGFQGYPGKIVYLDLKINSMLLCYLVFMVQDSIYNGVVRVYGKDTGGLHPL